MASSWRVTVKCKDPEKATTFKERFFKQIYEERGPTLVFETPLSDEALADKIVAAAEAEGHTAQKAKFEDPLDEAQPVDFW